LRFVPELGDAGEAYICFGFDAVEGRTIGAAHWRIGTGAVTVHHALLYAVTADFPDGPVRCDGMPEGSVGLHVFSPGGDDLVLPSDMGLRLPDGTRRLVVEVHAIRTGAGTVGQSEVTVCSGPDAPVHLAAVMPTVAPVPAIRPHQEEHSTGSCALGAEVHLWSAWPHMHLAGKEISGELVHGASTTTLVEVSDWDFHRQKTYPLMIDAVAGDEVRVSCTWDNATPNYILPGPLTTNEMCNLAFIAWPAAAATCH
jgi:hypothetical protein